MKKLFLMALAVATMTACEKPIVGDVDDDYFDDEEVVNPDVEPTKKFTFTVKGDFNSPTMRGYLQADGKDMTDLWVFDFMDGTCVQSLHQTNTDEDFGAPVMQLAYGAHHVYFVASRGATPTLNETAKTITWGTVRDTFWKDYEVSVVSTSNGNRAVTLDRVVTKLKVTIDDEIPTDCATLTITPATWYNGLNYTTGAILPMTGETAQTVSIPASYIGTVGQLNMTIFGFSTATEWTTDVTVAAKNGSSAVLGSVTIEDAPFKRNRSTEYHGNLFAVAASMGLTLNADWDDAATGNW
jgi:hypothetical protein